MKSTGIILLLLFWGFVSLAQVAVNIDGSSPAPTAMLDVKSNTKGVLIPRLSTTQMNSISSPETGLLIYNESTDSFWYFDASEWIEIAKYNIWHKNGPDRVMLVDPDDSIAIGTSVPTHKLTVNGTVSATSYYGDGSALTGTGDNLGNHLASQNIRTNGHWVNGDGGNEGIYVTNGGWVGIHTNSPDDLLDVSGGNLTLNAPQDGGVFLRFRENSAQRWTFLYRDWVNGTLVLKDEAGGNVVMGFEPFTGHVGIGSYEPDVPLHVAVGTDLSLGGGGYLMTGLSSSTNIVMDNNEIQSRNNGSASNLIINLGGGNVGIGEGTPTEKLDVSGNIYVNGNIDVEGNINTSTRTRYLTIPGNTFVSQYNDVAIVRTDYCVISDDEYITHEFFAPVYLPDGAVVTEVKIQVWDRDASYNATVELKRTHTVESSNISSTMATVSSSGSGSTQFYIFSTTSISYATIDNENYSYLVKASWYDASLAYGEIRLANVRIKYTVDELD